MSRNWETDVLIVGAGLVGLTLANLLKGSQLRVDLLDSQARPARPSPLARQREGCQLQSGFSPRVSAINLASETLLRRLGAWPADTERYQVFTRMNVWDGRGTAAIEFDAGMINASHLGSIIENQVLVQALDQQAGTLPDTCLHYGVEIVSLVAAPGGYQVTLADGREIQCRLLVGADGGSSLVRTLGQIRSLDWDYEQQALVTTVETMLPHQQVARQCFTAEGPLALLPLPDPHLCSVVWSSRDCVRLLEQDAPSFCQTVRQASESVLGEIRGVDQRFAFPLRQRHALRYVKAGMALIGDAAHTLHPLAGQGANLGLADAQALAVALQQCRFTANSPGSLETLRPYQQARRPANLVMTAAMEGFKRLFDTSDPGINWLRNKGLAAVSQQGTARAMLARAASGI